MNAGRSALLLLPVLLAAACQDGTQPTALGPISAVDEVGPRFELQSELAVLVLSFEASGLIEGRWLGTFINPHTGAEQELEVAPVSAERLGDVVHLTQTWRLIPPDPVHPPDPIVVGFTGILNPRAAFYRFLQGIVDAGFGNRVLGGSDQMVWPELIERSIAISEEAPFLNEQQKRDIRYNNAARFLRLSEEEIAGHHGR